MISKKTLQEYQYDSIDNYFNYIVESQVNGQHSQVKSLYNRLSQKQKRDFFHYITANNIKFDITRVF